MGEQIFGAWVLPFEVLSILLLAALVGADRAVPPGHRGTPDAEAGSLMHAVIPYVTAPCSSGWASTACCAGATRSSC
jgi:hypothetical protein